MNDAISLLEQLRDLLNRYGRIERANFVEELIRGGESDDFWRTVSGLEFWGGSGAVWEVEPFQFSHPSVATAEVDYRRFQTLTADLGDLLETKGLSSLSARTVSLFRRQLDDDG